MNFNARAAISSIKPTHPRLILTEERLNDIRSSDGDPVMQRLVSLIKTRAEELLGDEMYPYSIPDGIRLLSTSRRVLSRILIQSVAYNITGDERYAECAYAQLKTAAEYPDWNPKHHLDVGEMNTAFAFGYDLLYEWLGEERRAVLRYAMLHHGIEKTMEDYLDKERERTYRWYQATPGNNWKLVCNGGTTLSALSMIDDLSGDEREMCLDALDIAFKSSYDATLDLFRKENGDYHEGVTYWEYACNYWAYHSAALKSALGSDFGLSDAEGLRRSPYFIIQLCGNTFNRFNFSDCGEGISKPYVMMYFADILNDPALASVRADAIMNDGAFESPDILFYRSKEHASLSSLPNGFGGVGLDNASFRTGRGEDDLYCAIHFGANHSPHAHLDTGCFIIESENERFITDLGPDDYNLRPYRDAYRYRAEGHNTLVFNPSLDGGQAYRCSSVITDFENSEELGRAVGDISEAYPGKTVKRSLELDRTERAITVSDIISCDDCDTLYWFAHTRADVKLEDGGRVAVMTLNGKLLYAESLGDGVFELSPAIPFPTSPIPECAVYESGKEVPQNDNKGVQKLVIKTTSGRSRHIAVKFKQIKG